MNRAKGRLERVKGILKRFREAVLAAACSGELTREWREGHATRSSAVALDELSASLGELKTRRDVPTRIEPPDALAELEPPHVAVVSVAALFAAARSSM